MDDCIFCKIIHGDIPSEKVYEDDRVLAFLDIAPTRYGHTLVIPKEHYPTLSETPDETLADVMRVTRKIAQALVGANLGEATNITFNNGAASGQDVFHTHAHVIPRTAGDGLQTWPHQTYDTQEAMKKTGEALRQAMADLA